jgi:thymidylate kinase
MLILVEGLERCGKTTTVNYLRSVIDNPRIIVHHSAKPPKGLTRQQAQTWSAIHYTETMGMFSKLSENGWDIIMDRAHIGEYVYGHMYRRNDKNDRYIFETEHFIDISKTYLVLLTDDPHSVYSREDGQSLSTNVDAIEAERERFIEGVGISRILNKLHIDWTNDFDDVPFAEKQKTYFKKLNNFLEIF